jgi:hypothetical protein
MPSLFTFAVSSEDVFMVVDAATPLDACVQSMQLMGTDDPFCVGEAFLVTRKGYSPDEAVLVSLKAVQQQLAMAEAESPEPDNICPPF